MDRVFRHAISQRNKSRGSNTWFGSYIDPITGLAAWKSLKTEKKGEAQAWLDQMNARRFLPQEQKAAFSTVSVDEAVEAFMLDAKNVRKLSGATLEEYKNRFAPFRRFLESKGASLLSNITPALCAEFAQEDFADLGAHAVRNKLMMYRCFFSWAQDRYDLQAKNPFKKITVPKTKSMPRDFWTLEECEKIIAAAPDPEIKCWFALMAFAGLRKEEARLLRIENLEGGRVSLVGKGGKAATVPVSSRLRTHLNEYMAQRGEYPGFLFPKLSQAGKNNDYIIKAAFKKSGLETPGTAHCHRFRHSFASNLIRAGRNIKAVQMLMRHESVALTLNTYGHLLPSDLVDAVEL